MRVPEAKIEIIEGYHQGQSYDVQGETTLGRSPSNAICLYDSRASRQHALIRTSPAGDGYVVTDLGSGNGTYVNQTKLERGMPYSLSDGDFIYIGSTRLLFRMCRSSDRHPTPPTQIPAAPVLKSGDTTFAVKMDAGGGDMPEIGHTLDASINLLEAQAEEQSATTIRRLQAIVTVTNELGEVTEQDELLDRIMDKIFDIFPHADRAFVLLKNADEKMVPAIARTRNVAPGQDAEVAISSTIINSVTENKQSILSSDARQDFGEQQSIVDLSIRSMMCAPLICKDDILGVISVDTTSTTQKFCKDDLAMLTGIAAQAATALKNAALYDQVEAEIQTRSELSRYMSPDFAKAIVDGTISAELGAKRTTGTILFCDIVGFTSMSENTEPVGLVENLNRYFKITTDVIARNKGTINKFGGDMVLAFWNVMFPDDSPALNAIKAGVQMQAAVWYFDLACMEKGIDPIHMGIGINTGEFAAGNIGGERMEYTVIGDNVNLAQRIESMAGRWQVFVSESTYRGAKDDCVAINLPPVQVKGKSEPVEVFSIRGVRGANNAMLFNIPVKVLDSDENVCGEGLITGSAGEGENKKLFFSVDRALPGGSLVMLDFDLPEYHGNLRLMGRLDDETHETFYGQESFSKSSLGNLQATAVDTKTTISSLQGSDEVMGFLTPGSVLGSKCDWDDIMRR